MAFRPNHSQSAREARAGFLVAAAEQSPLQRQSRQPFRFGLNFAMKKSQQLFKGEQEHALDTIHDIAGPVAIGAGHILYFRWVCSYLACRRSCCSTHPIASRTQGRLTRAQTANTETARPCSQQTPQIERAAVGIRGGRCGPWIGIGIQLGHTAQTTTASQTCDARNVQHE